MKNIIVTFALIFTLGLSAQTKTTSTREVTTVKLTPEMSAKKDVATLSNIVMIDDKTQKSLQEILASKYDILYNTKNLSPERKSVLSQSISSQIENVVGKETFTKIKSDKILYESLIN